MKKTILFLSLAVPVLAQPEFRPLFNGRDLTGWQPVLENAAFGKDPQNLITVHDGAIHMYRNVKHGDLAPFGVIVSDESFSRYHLRFQYRWMGKRFAPRKDAIRDAGLIYHAYQSSRVWPSGIENQVQEGDTGDLIWCNSNGFTWMRPAGEAAPEGQGMPGLLPEHGGILREIGFNYEYIGRFPEYDNYHGWTTVDTIVQADEWAIHKINGRVCTRLRDFKEKGHEAKPLTEGRITLQLEGAEIQYRDIGIRELPEPLRSADKQVTLAARHGDTARESIVITNPGSSPLDATPRILGKDADFFTIEPAEARVEAGESATFQVGFSPLGHGGRYAAGVQFGPEDTGLFVPLSGLGHGDGTEPALQEILDALNIPATVQPGRWIDPKAPRIGDSIHARSFIPAENGRASIVLLAAFPDDDSPALPISLFSEVDPALQPIAAAKPSGVLQNEILTKARSGKLTPDDLTTFSAPDAAFGLCLGEDSSTDFDRKSAIDLRHKARVFPVRRILETKLEDAYLVCFETGGVCDYNDAIYLLANVIPWRIPESRPSEEKRWSIEEIKKALGH